VTDDLFRTRRSDPPAVRLLKAIFAADEEHEVAEDEKRARALDSGIKALKAVLAHKCRGGAGS